MFLKWAENKGQAAKKVLKNWRVLFGKKYINILIFFVGLYSTKKGLKFDNFISKIVNFTKLDKFQYKVSLKNIRLPSGKAKIMAIYSIFLNVYSCTQLEILFSKCGGLVKAVYNTTYYLSF